MRPKRDEKGHFPAYAWPGGYPIIYITCDGGDVLCATCADREMEKVEADIHWEGPAYFCDECSKEIPSAYGDPDEPEET